MASPWEKYSNPAAKYGADPTKVKQDQRADEDQNFQRNNDGRAADAADRAAKAAALAEANAAKANDLATKKLAIDMAKEGVMFSPDGQIVKNPNGPIGGDAKGEGKTPRPTALASLVEQINRTQQLYDSNIAPEKYGMLSSIGDWLGPIVSDDNAQFDVAGAQIAEKGLAAFRIPGVGTQTERDAIMFERANAPTSAMRDIAIEEQLRGMRARVEEEYSALGLGAPNWTGLAGGKPSGSGPSDAQVTMGDALQQGQYNSTNTETQVGATDENIVTPQDQEISARLSSLWRSGASYDQLMQEYDSINQEYGFGGRYKPSVSGEVLKQQAGLPGRERPGFNPVATGRKSDLQNAKDYYLDGKTGALATSYFDGAGFGLSDEVAGLFGGEEAAQQAQFAKEYLADNNPVSSTLGSLGGGLTAVGALQKGVMGLGGKLAASGNQTARSVAGRVAGGNAAGGTTANAIYGTGYGAGSDNENRLRGAGVGLGASLLGDYAGQAIGRNVAQSGIVGKARNVVRQATGKEPMRPMPQMSKTDNMMVNADPNGQALDRLSTAKDLQVPMMLADVTPEFRALAGATARRSPTARGMAEEAFTPRSRGQYERLTGAIDRDLGPTANIPQYSEDLIKQAQANSRPFYDEAFSAPGASSVDISGIAKTPMGQQGIGNAYNSVRNTLGPDGQPLDPTSLGFDIAEGTSEATIGRTPSFETLDYFKKGLDEIIDAGFDPMTKRYTADASAAIQLKQNLVGQIDKVNPAYAQARQAYAGPAGEREALRLGQSSGNMTPDQMQYTIKDFSPEKRAQFALGDRSRMADQAASVRYSGNPWEAAFGSPKAEQRLAISHPNASPRFGQQYGMERDIAVSNQSILGGSQTAERLIGDNQFAGNMMSDVAFDAMTTGTPLKTGATLLGRFAKDELGRFGAKNKADTLAPILFDTDIDRAVNAFLKLQNKPKVIEKARGILGRVASQRTGRGLGLAAPIAALPFVQE